MRQGPQGDIPPTSTCEETSFVPSFAPSIASVNHSDGGQHIQEEKQTKEDVEIEKFFEDRMLDFIISRYTTTNNFRKDEKEKKERIAISPHLSESVQELQNKIMLVVDEFDKLHVHAKEWNFPIDIFLNDREKLKGLLGIKDPLQIH
jgi:hypothetical protein